jgi:hypothetical protein
MGREIENDDVIDLFLNRKFDKRIKYSIGLGIRDQWEHSNDFVHRPVWKTLNMEYDFKRKPSVGGMRRVQVKGSNYEHLYFETEPWDSVTEFRTIRELLIGYSLRKEQNCLITKNDYLKFDEYIEEQTQDITRWSRGGTARLRQELCAAIHTRQVGFELVLYDQLDGHGKIPKRFKGKEIIFQKDFVQMLNDVGIPCKRHDLKNATNRAFVPHNVPDKAGTRELLRRLKEKYVPNLDIEKILCRPSELNISIDWVDGTPLN